MTFFTFQILVDLVLYSMAKILDRLQKPVACTNLGNGLVLASNNEGSVCYSMLSSIMPQWVDRTIRWVSGFIVSPVDKKDFKNIVLCRRVKVHYKYN